MKVGVSGLEDVVRAKKELDLAIRRTSTVQETELDKLVAEAYPKMLEMAPYDTGKLESGIYCRRSRGTKNCGVVAGAVALNPRTHYNYAVIQHENEDYEHPVKGEAHFISQPFQAAVDNFMRRLSERLASLW